MKDYSDELKTLQDTFEMSKSVSRLAHDKIAKYRRYYQDVDGTIDAQDQSIRTSKNKSTYRSRRIKKALGRLIATVTESILKDPKLFVVSAPENKDSKMGKILNYQWNNELDKNYMIKKLAHSYIVDGIAIAKVEWDYKQEIEEQVLALTEEEEVKEFIFGVSDPEKQKKLIDIYNKDGKIPVGKETITTVIDNKPTIKYIDPVSVYIDPTAKTIDDAMFIIEEYFVSYSDIVKNKDSYLNIDKVIKKAFENANSDSSMPNYGDYSVDDQDFVDNFQDLARKKVRMYEYWGYVPDANDNLVPIVASWVNDTLIRYEENPYSHKKIPYVSATFGTDSTNIFGESLSEVMHQDQVGYTRIMRVLDNSAIEATNIQEFIDDRLFNGDMVQENNYKNGKTVYTRGGIDPRTAIYRRTIDPLPQNVGFLKDAYDIELNSIVDLSPKEQELDTSGVGFSADPAGDYESSILRSMLDMLSSSGSRIVEMNQQYLQLGTKMKDSHTGDETMINSEKHLSGSHKCSAIAMTMREKNLTAGRLSNMLQKQSANMTPELAGIHYAKIAELWGQYDLADKVLKEVMTPPPPDPLVELDIERAKLENAKIELELEKVKAETAYFNMRSKDNESKAFERYANIEIGGLGAKANMLEAQGEAYAADAAKRIAQNKLFEQEFIRVNDGDYRREQEEDHEFQHAANLEREKIRTERELKLNEAKALAAKSEKKDDNSEAEDKAMDDTMKEYLRSGTTENEYDPFESLFTGLKGGEQDYDSIENQITTEAKNNAKL